MHPNAAQLLFAVMVTGSFLGFRRAADENLPKYKHDAQASEQVRSLWTHLLALRAGIIFSAARLIPSTPFDIVFLPIATVDSPVDG